MSLIYTDVKNLTETEWQQLRSSFVERGMVGGSDAGTLLGLNKYKSPINLYYQSLALTSLPNKMNGAMLHGKQLESYVAGCWQYWDGTEEGWVANTLANNKIKTYRRVRSIIENTKYPQLFANIDGKITKHPIYGKKSGVLEIKTISGYSSDNYEGGIPPSYLIQLQHYMLVMGLSWGEICYLKDGRDLDCLTFEADKELQDRIIYESTQFYNRVQHAKEEIKNGKTLDEKFQIASQFEPDADSSQAFNHFISAKHKAREVELSIQGDSTHQEWAEQYVRYSELGKKIDEHKTLYQNKLKQVLEKDGATNLILPNGKITWRKQFNVKL
jgi:putative phage-type endonuclease